MVIRRLVFVVMAVAVAGGLASGAPAAVPSPPDGAPADAALGERLYGRDCASCHGPSGEGSPRGDPLVDVGAASAHYMLVSGRMPIVEPNERLRRGEPAYGDEELAALVAHVAGFGEGPPVPEVDLEGADLTTGGRLYRVHCAACHGATGIGSALAFDQFAPSVLLSEPTVVATAMVVGPGTMPAFAPAVFTSNEVDDITAYIQYLADPPDPGGAPLGGAGRVDEGLVAWAVGLVGLVLVARWIGSRA